jgi:hypothetical protein
VLGLVDADERELPAGVVDDHRALRVVDVRHVDAAYVDAAPVEPSEALAAERVERAGEHDDVGRLATRDPVEVRLRHRRPGPQRDELVVEKAVDEIGVAVRARGPALVGVREEVRVVVPPHRHAPRSPQRRQLARRAPPLLLRVRADEALVEDRTHQLQAPLLEVRGSGARRGVDAAPLLELGVDLVGVRLPIDVRHQDGPVEHLAVGEDVHAVAVVVERRHLVGELPHLAILGVEDVRAVRLVEDTLHVLGADQASGDVVALDEHGLDARAREAVRQRAARQTGPDDQDPASAAHRHCAVHGLTSQRAVPGRLGGQPPGAP